MGKIIELSLARAWDDRMLETKEPPDWTTIPAQMRAATGLGFDARAATETPYDPLLSLALAAQTPSRIELATGIAADSSRSPTAMAPRLLNF